ncbi:MAG: sigma 54-interacting transcriptional regulator [Deltaproteobacteria bacterium]|jgi:arginine utilization regulatory protein|nr:sigma 54-interacting transcriptional regulator [Deltaproteobacteria bacterium]
MPLSTFFQNLGANADNLQKLFDLLPIGVMAIDCNNTIIYFNRAQGIIDNLTASEVLGRKERDVYGLPDFSPGVMRTCQKMKRPILGFMCTYYTTKNPSRIISGAFWTFPLFDAHNTITGSVCFTIPTAELTAGLPKSVIWPEFLPLTRPSKVIIGENHVLTKTINVAKNLADSPSPILISGETGVGKELVARLVHEHSPRANLPFLPINCAAIPLQLLEGLLFGTTKGSFTGAVDRAGLFEDANGGTVYLDEIDSMPMELQPKLLRLLQEMKVSRLGSSKEIKLDVRIVSSIGSTSQEALELGKIRPDLFYRLAVIVLHVPPLRERLDDLDELINFFVAKYNQQLKRKVVGFDDQVLGWFKRYSWPGNIRELENIVAGAINLAKNETLLTVDHLPYHYVFLKEPEEQFSPASNETPKTDEDSSIEEMLVAPNQPEQEKTYQESEIMAIKKHLDQTNGKITQAARNLGISRQLLSYKMRKYGLSRYKFLPRYH